MAAIRTLVVGDGRMGTLVLEALRADDAFEPVGMVGLEAMGDLVSGAAPAADLAIDFSNKGMLPALAAYVEREGCALLTGTTGLDDADMATLGRLAARVPVVHSANYSLGVAVLRRLAAEASRLLAGWAVEIVETHHTRKVDAPSGTAMARLAAVDPEGARPVRHGREGMVGERPAGEIGMHAVRGGTVAGTHELHLFGEDEEVCLTHRATSRRIFVAGAVACARRLVEAGPGLHAFDELMLS